MALWNKFTVAEKAVLTLWLAHVIAWLAAKNFGIIALEIAAQAMVTIAFALMTATGMTMWIYSHNRVIALVLMVVGVGLGGYATGDFLLGHTGLTPAAEYLSGYLIVTMLSLMLHAGLQGRPDWVVSPAER